MTKQEVNGIMQSLENRFGVLDYCEACEAFAKDTEEWGGLQPGQLYTMREDGTWVETCDNAHGGPSVAWAFHETFSSTEDLSDSCAVHYDMWLQENHDAMMEDCED